MRVCRGDEGQKVFEPQEYLQQPQIVSYFSLLSVMARTPSKTVEDEDLDSAIALISTVEALQEISSQ